MGCFSSGPCGFHSFPPSIISLGTDFKDRMDLDLAGYRLRLEHCFTCPLAFCSVTPQSSLRQTKTHQSQTQHPKAFNSIHSWSPSDLFHCNLVAWNMQMPPAKRWRPHLPLTPAQLCHPHSPYLWLPNRAVPPTRGLPRGMPARTPCFLALSHVHQFAPELLHSFFRPSELLHEWASLPGGAFASVCVAEATGPVVQRWPKHPLRLANHAVIEQLGRAEVLCHVVQGW